MDPIEHYTLTKAEVLDLYRTAKSLIQQCERLLLRTQLTENRKTTSIAVTLTK